MTGRDEDDGWDDLTLPRLKRGIAARNARLDEQNRLRRAVEANGGKLTLFEADGVRTVRLWPDGISDEVKEQINRADEILLDGALALGLLGPVGLRLRGEPAGDIGPFRPPAATDPCGALLRRVPGDHSGW